METDKKVDCLIIDSDKNDQDLLIQYCKNIKLFRHIVTAVDGIEATIKLKNQRFGLVIIDINTPKKDALKIISGLKHDSSINKKAAILMTSGDLKEGQLATAIRSGVKSYIFKPLNENNFIKKVHSIVCKETPIVVDKSFIYKK